MSGGEMILIRYGISSVIVVVGEKRVLMIGGRRVLNVVAISSLATLAK